MISRDNSEYSNSNVYVHPTAIVDSGAKIGEGTKIWHFSHICGKAIIGKNCVFGQNTMVADGVKIGNNVKVQNNVSIYSGVIIEDDVFLGPSCVLTNISNPRSQINRKKLYEKTFIQKGATIGANATIVSGVNLGLYSFISAGAVITKSVGNYALMKGVPAKQDGWMSRHGHPLIKSENSEIYVCPESKLKYIMKNNSIECIELSENDVIPEKLSNAKLNYRFYKGNKVGK